MQLGWLAIAIIATVTYHVVLKVTPPAASPFPSLAVSYAAGALILLGVGVTFFQERLTAINVGGIALSIVGLWLVNSR